MTPASMFVRRWSFVLALLFGAFAAYISLVPFRFAHVDGLGEMVDLFLRRFEPGMTSRGNFLANVLLFVPVGFFGLAALVTPPTRTWRRGLAMLLVGAAAVLLSVTIEFLQTIVPGRTPSLADMAAQTVGAALAMVGWLGLSGDVHRIAEGWLAGRIGSKASNWVTVLTGYSILRTIIILLPLDVTVDLGALLAKFRRGQVVINPLASTDWLPRNLPDTMANAALAIPMGVLLCIGTSASGSRRSRRQALAIGSLWFALIEAAQLFIQSRTADAADFLVNVAGLTIGIVLVDALAPAAPPVAAVPRSRALPWGALAGVAAALGVYVVYNWVPFDFNFDPRFIRARSHMVVGVPFYGYYVNPEFKAITDVAVKLSMAAPIGLFLRRSIAPGLTRVSRVFGATIAVAAAAFFSVIEAGQVLLATRYPDDTDILLAVVGTWMGWTLSELWSRPRAREQAHMADADSEDRTNDDLDPRESREDGHRRARLLGQSQRQRRRRR